jgi:hypothetical protein
MLLDFIDRRGMWEGKYPIDESNLVMEVWHSYYSSKEHPCGTVGCLAGHMMMDPIWNDLGFVPNYRYTETPLVNHGLVPYALEPSYTPKGSFKYESYSAIVAFFGSEKVVDIFNPTSYLYGMFPSGITIKDVRRSIQDVMDRVK